MRRLLYALTATVIVLAILTLAGFAALYGEVTALRRQIRTGSSLESLSAPMSTLPSPALPTSVAPNNLTAAVTQVSRGNGVVSLTILLQSGSPLDLFSVPPLLVDASGRGYPATTESQQAAQLAALNLGQGGAASLALDFQVPDSFQGIEVVFNNGSSSAIAPPLRATIR